MIEHVIKALSGLSASTASQLKSEPAGNGRRMRSAKGVVCALAAMLVAAFAAPSAYATLPVKILSAQLPISGGVLTGSSPTGVAIDANGNIYVADYALNQIDVINPNTLAVSVFISSTTPLGLSATSLIQPQQLAVIGTNLYIADGGNNRIVQYPLTGGNPPGAEVDGLTYIYSLAADPAGNLWGIETSSCATECQIVEFSAASLGSFATATPTTVLATSDLSGGTPNNMVGPAGLTFDASGNMYIADSGGNEIYEAPYQVGGPPYYTGATVTPFLSVASPGQMAFDPHGNFYAVNRSTFTVTTWAAVGGFTNSNALTIGLLGANAIALDASGNLYLTEDSTGNAVEKIFPQVYGSSSVSFGTQSAATAAEMQVVATIQAGTAVHRVAVLTDGQATMDFTGSNALQLADPNSCVNLYNGLSTVTCTGDGVFNPYGPGNRSGVIEVVGAPGPYTPVLAKLYVGGNGVAPLLGFSPPQKLASVLGGASGLFHGVSPALNSPYSMTTDAQGYVYIADSGNNRVIIAPPSDLTCSLADCTILTTSIAGPDGVAVDGAGNVYVASTGNSELLEFPYTVGSNAPKAYGAPTQLATSLSPLLALPQGIALDSGGNLYVSDTTRKRVIKIPQSDLQCSVAADCTLIDNNPSDGSLDLNAPVGVAVDGNDNVYIADSANNFVVMVPPTDATCALGQCVNVASNIEFQGSGAEPLGVAIDTSGNVFIANRNQPYLVEVPAAVLISDPACTTLTDCPSTLGTTLGLKEPTGIAAGSNGDLFVADWGNKRIVEYDVSDAPTLSFATQTEAGSTDTTDGNAGSLTTNLINLGNATLTFEMAPAVPGFNPAASAGFLQTNAGTCPLLENPSGTYSLGAGLSCTAAAEFTPDNAETINTGIAEQNCTSPATCNTTGGLYVLNNTQGGNNFPYTSSLIANLEGSSNTTQTITLNTAVGTPAGVTLTGGGTYTVNTSQTINAVSPYTDGNNTVWHWSSWSNAGTESQSVNVNPEASTDSYTATYNVYSYQLTMAINGSNGCSGTTTPAAGSSNITSPFTANISATPIGVGCVFTGWTVSTNGALTSSSTTNANTVTLSGETTVTANFDLQTYTVTVQSSPVSAAVSINGNPGPSSNGTGSANTLIYYGTTAAITAAASGTSGGDLYSFNGWTPTDGSNSSNASENTATITGTKTYTANYTVTGYELTVNVLPVTPGLCFNSTASATTADNTGTPDYYTPNTIVQITAIPAAGCYFAGWTGATTVGPSGGGGPLSNPGRAVSHVKMTGPVTISANFLPIPYFVVTVLGDDPIGTSSPAAGTPGNCVAYVPTSLSPVTPTPASLTTLNDPTNANCSLRDAVTAAESIQGVSSINSGGAGNILWSAMSGDSGYTQPLKGATFLQSQLYNIVGMINITGPGAGVIDVDGDNTYTVFNISDTMTAPINSQVDNGTTATISGLTISDGNGANGGGVDVSGGLALRPQVVTLSNDAFYHNTATTSGGALATAGKATITVSNSSFSTNNAVTSGGAIYVDAPTTVTNVSFSNDTSVDGGGIYLDTLGTLTVADSTFNAENGTTAGGAIYANAGMTVNYSTFFANQSSAGNGGAMYIAAGTLNGNNLTLSNNQALVGNGAGIYNNATLNLNNSIMSGNQSKGAAGIDTVGAAVTNTNTNDFYGNIDSATDLEDDCYRCALTGGTNVNNIVIVPGSTTVNANPNLTTALATNDSNSLVAPPVSTTPITDPVALISTASQTLIPLPNSAAICAAAANLIPNGYTTDQRGQPNVNSVYSTSPCYDLGAVQTSYAMSAFNPAIPASVEAVSGDVTAGLALTESGVAFTAANGFSATGEDIAATVTDAGGLLSGTGTPPSVTDSTLPATGIATFTNLTFTEPTTPPYSDTLVGTVVLNSNVPPSASTSAPLALTTSSPIVIDAHAVQVTVSTSVAGLSYSIGGASPFYNPDLATPVTPPASYTTSQTPYLVDGTSYTLTTTSPQYDIGNDTQYTFQYWVNGGVNQTTGVLTDSITGPASATTYTAQFSTAYLLTVNVNIAGDATSECASASATASGSFYSSATTAISATTGSLACRFTGWTTSTSASFANANNASTTVNMSSAPETITANFDVQTYTISVATTPAGLKVNTSGTNGSNAPFTNTAVTATESDTVLGGSAYNFSAVSPQFGATGVEYLFTTWNFGVPGSRTSATQTLTSATANHTYTATFSTNYLLTATPNNGGWGTVTPSTPTYYDSGALGSRFVAITATPATNYYFVNWTGSGQINNTSAASTRINMTTGPQTITANFALDATLSVSVSPASGMCSDSIATPATGNYYSPGSDVTLSATPAAGCYFAGWTGPVNGAAGSASNSVNIGTSNVAVTANFLPYPTLAVNVANNGSCAGAATPASGLAYAPGTVVPLTATTSAGCYFAGWSTSTSDVFAGSVGTASNSITILTTPSQSITATFNPIPGYIVTQIADDGTANNGADCSSGTGSTCTLRDAMAFALGNNGGAGNITYASGVTGTTTLTSALPSLTGLITITGPGANVVDVDGDNTYNVFSITGNAVNGNTLAISGLTISGGNSATGAGVNVTGGTVALSNLAFLHNAATTGGGLATSGSSATTLSNSSFSIDSATGNGGAVYNNAGLTLTNVSFSRDTAVSGAGIYNDALGTLSVSDSTFSGETAATSGGGIYNAGTSASTAVYESTFFQNAATTANGGAIYNAAGTLTANNLTIANNAALGGNGAGIYNTATLVINNSIITGGSSKGAAGIDTEGAATTTATTNDFFNNVDTQTSLEDDCYRCTTNTGAITASPNLATALGTNNSNSAIVPPVYPTGTASETLLPLPGSAAICAGTIPLAGATDQRGLANSNTGYSVNPCYDLGAVQTEYALSFTTTPPSTLGPTEIMSPAQVVAITESGSAFTGAAVTVTMTDLNSALTGGSAAATDGSGNATFNSLTFSATANDTLTGSVVLNSGVAASVSTAPSNPFTVAQITTNLTYSPTTTSQTYGSRVPNGALNAAVTNPGDTGTFTYTATNNSTSAVTVPLTSTSVLPVGTYTLSVTFAPDNTVEFSTPSAVVGTTTYTVNAETPTVTFPFSSRDQRITYGSYVTLNANATVGGFGGFGGTNINSSGSFTYVTGSCATPTATITPTTVLNAGTYTVLACFTPTAPSNYASASGSATVTVTAANVPITALNLGTNPQPYGAPITPSATEGQATVGGSSYTPSGTFTYTYTPAGGSATALTPGTTVLTVGTYRITATFTPGTANGDSTNFAVSTTSGSYSVTQVTPTMTFVPAPNSQNYGTPIATTSLDAVATNANIASNPNTNPANPVVGTYTYTTLVNGIPNTTITGGTSGTVLTAGTYSIKVTFAPTDTLDYASATTNAVYTVNPTTPTLTFVPAPPSQFFGTPISGGSLDAVATANGLTIAGSVSYNLGSTTGPAVLPGVTILSASATPYTIWATFTPNDTVDYSTTNLATASASYTVNPATPTITLTTSTTPIFSQNAVTFTALVSLLGGGPGNTVSYLNGGTVDFYNGDPAGTGVLLGAGTIVNGVATYTAPANTFMTMGGYKIYAVYVASTNFVTAESLPLTETVTDFNFTLSLNSVTVQPGGAAVINFTATPLGSSTFPTTIVLSLSGLPSGASYSFSPASLLAGTGTQPVVLTINVPPAAAVVKAEPTGGFSGKLPLAFALLLLPFAGSLRKNSKRLARLFSILLLVIAGLTATIGLSGCGANIGGYFGQQAQTYTLTLTGTSGTLSHSTTITLTVE